MSKIAIVGSHGLYANYGGWDQLVKNLAERKSSEQEYIIFNSAETSKDITPPDGVKVKRLRVKASGFQGLFYDFWSILICYFKVDTILLLGVQGIPLITILRLFKKVNIVSNVGGIEWERPKFGYFSKLYLKFCFNLSFKYSNYVVLDNEHYNIFTPQKSQAKIVVIPYGGEIDTSLSISNNIINKYPFINNEYFLSISRALEDNLILELCECFKDMKEKLVLISNFSSSSYGKSVFDKYKSYSNIILIDGLYVKPELDLIRRACKGYIHTHTLCGTAPSLVEMIISRVPILSTDIPQNRFTLNNQGFFYNSFDDLKDCISNEKEFIKYIPSIALLKKYNWDNIINDYENLF